MARTANSKSVKNKKSKSLNKVQKELQKVRENTMKRDMQRYALVDFENTNDLCKFVLINKKDNKNLIIKIKKKKEISCSCFDFKIRCKKNNINCKHILYIGSQILDLKMDNYHEK